MHRPSFPRVLTRVLVALIVASTLLVSGCAGKQNPEATSAQASRPELPPGTDRWDGGALLLPSRAPVVGLARPDALLENARRLRSWLAAEPAMFGEEGETFVQQFRAGWRQLSKGLGGDPLKDEAAERVGIAISRPIYLGVYPAAGPGSSFVEHVESAIRDAAEIDEETKLSTALTEMRDGVREIPSGLTRTVTERIETTSPRAGFRVAIPVEHPATFVGQLDAFASFAGFEELPRGEDAWPGSDAAAGTFSDSETAGPQLEPVGYVNTQSRWPAFLVRPGSNWVQVDILFEVFETGNRQKSEGELAAQFRSSLTTLVEEFGSGRPAAPRPTDEPALSVAADQARTSVFARMQAYKRVLDAVPQVAVGRRNDILVAGLQRAVQIGENWSLGSESLTGLSYSFHGRDAEEGELFQTGMTLYGPRPSKPPSVAPATASLGIRQRAFGLSFSLEPIFAPDWKEWLGLENPSEIVGNSETAERNPALYLLSLPRNLALFLVNVETMVRDSIPETLRPLHERRGHLQRLEIATSGLDPGALRRRPRLAGLLTFDPESSKADIRQTLESLPPFAEFLFEIGDARIGPSRDNDVEVPDSLEIGSLETVGLPESHPAHPTRYYAHVSEERSFLFFSHGLAESEARSEVEALLERGGAKKREPAFFGRLEPATAVAALTTFDPDALQPIDAGILAQRIGPMELSIDPAHREDVQMLRYRFELREPPSL